MYSVEEITKRIYPVAEKHSLPGVWLFGSYARGEATENSDIDILIDADNIKGIWKLVGVFADFRDALEKETDMITLEKLSSNDPLDKYFIQNVTRDMVKIW
jgi:predicted nucleotidyltransferase